MEPAAPEPASLPNTAIAAALDELADLSELDGAIIHRVLAYRTAAATVRDAPVSVAGLARAGRATTLPGVGGTIQEKIVALLDTGAIPATEKLRAKFPPGLLALTRLPGLGPKRARLIHQALGVGSLEELREAALAQRLRDVRGLGPKFEESVLAALQAGAGEREPARVLLPRALVIGEQILAGLRERVGGEDEGVRLELAGSARRRADSVKDLDVIAATADPAALLAALPGLEAIASVSAPRESGARALAHTGLPIDLRVVRPGQYGNLLQHFTGSKAHNTSLRESAVRAGLHVSEYGIAGGGADGERLECAREEEVYARLGMAWIEPELREGRGELEAARDGGAALPMLVRESDLRGDLHCHTIASDGRNTIEEMALAARARGYEYLAITDHSASHGFGNNVPPDELRRHAERVREVDARLEGIRLLAGSEVNILPDGSLDYDDQLLAELDWVVASIHSGLRGTERALTDRMLAAIEHPLVDAIGHPTGRLIGRRAPSPLVLEEVFAAAARTGTLLEINGNPDRRDLSDVHARAAAAAGVTLVVDSDAHGVEVLANVRWGIATARRAWLTREQVANTRPWAELSRRRTRG